MIRVCLLCALILGIFFQMPARRTSQSVRSEKERAVRQITETNRKISANEAQTERQLAQLQSVNAGIARQSEQLEKLQRKRIELDKQVTALEDSVAFLDSKIERLRTSYAKVLRSLRRQRALASATAVAFASESAVQASRRLRYLDQLSRWEQKEANSLKQAIADVSARRDHLAQARIKVEENEAEQQSRLEELSIRQQKAQELVTSLRKQGSTLRDVLRKQKEQAEQLERELRRVIEEEAQEAARTGKKKEQSTSEAGTVDFVNAKGKLSRPIDKPSTIVAGFGRRTHEEFEKVTVQNNGVDFEAAAGANAISVFPGVVSMVIVMQGYNNVVLVRHGEYLTVYAGLADVAVRKGDKVKTGQVLGRIVPSADDSGNVRLHFEVRHEKDKLNPEEWLAR